VAHPPRLVLSAYRDAGRPARRDDQSKVRLAAEEVRDRTGRRSEYRGGRHDRRRDLLDSRGRGTHFGVRLPLSFAIGAVVAGLAAYGYAALGRTFPSVGGAVTFLVRGYGDGVASGSLNLFQYFSYIISIALYATGFAAYAATFIDLPSKVWAVGVVLAFTAINFLGARIMGRAESVIVIIKVVILIVFIAAAFIGLPGNGLSRLSPATWPDPLAIFTGAGLLFVGYEGFGLITNAAANMAKPKRELPRALYGSVAIVSVIYILVASGVVTNVPLNVLKGLGDSGSPSPPNHRSARQASG
jgi:amino acid transporter